MRIRNFLIGFRQNNVNEMISDLNTDVDNFMDQYDKVGALHGVIVNDNRRPTYRISRYERLRRDNGLALRNKLRQKIKDHNMYPSL